MDTESVISQIQNVLPKYTEAFTDVLNVQELTCNNLLVTVKTATNHNLINGEYVNIKGAYCLNEISEISLNGNWAEITCVDSHDLTEGWQESVYITGFTNQALNGNYKLLSVDSSKKFIIEIIGKTVNDLAGNLFLNEDRVGYNGRFPVATVGDKTFTYQLSSTLPPASGQIKVLTKIRFSGTIDIDEAVKAYTSQSSDKFWGFVVGEDSVGSKNKQNFTDSVSRYEAGQEFKQDIVEPFNIYIFIPTITSHAARKECDNAKKIIRKCLFKTLLGVKFDSGFSQNKTTGVTYVSDGVLGYKETFYIHRFSFETISIVTRKDIIEPDDTFAFRNFEISYQNNKSNVILNINGEPNY